MTLAPLAITSAILALALAASSAGCLVLWTRLRALRRAHEGAGPAPAPGPEPAPIEGPSKRAEGRRAQGSRLSRVEPSGPLASVAAVAHPGGPRVARRLDAGHPSASGGGPTLISVPSLSRARASLTPSEAAADLDRRFGGVWALADSGASAEAVARETGYPVGQVELILGLRRRLSAAEAGTDA